MRYLSICLIFILCATLSADVPEIKEEGLIAASRTLRQRPQYYRQLYPVRPESYSRVGYYFYYQDPPYNPYSRRPPPHYPPGYFYFYQPLPSDVN